MPKLHISEYGGIDSREQVAKEPALNEQAVTYSTSTQSNALNSATGLVRLCSDGAAYLAFGQNPTADADSKFLPANTPEYFRVSKNAGVVISVYDGTS